VGDIYIERERGEKGKKGKRGKRGEREIEREKYVFYLLAEILVLVFLQVEQLEKDQKAFPL
jgi:hypothetical protein